MSEMPDYFEGKWKYDISPFKKKKKKYVCINR